MDGTEDRIEFIVLLVFVHLCVLLEEETNVAERQKAKLIF